MNVLQRRVQRGEMRKAVRHSLHVPAYIVVGDRSTRQNCIIHDMSLVGARLTIGIQSNKVPDRFTLVLSRQCRVVRRADGQLGVEFLPGEG